ncbi:glycoside hydrolase family 32 protein [Amnibacterium kyonggiense]|uniref:beta-fructofuranosidase n=1 Tax=Amnibacterium kyonggiense TaxID=595671 RepID=A0A4R7FSJ3_9MICO|nr:glycoside hydrolase family 32 protein [Amnibacterium kyonggiense]TDS80813.1 beta-fructofuranosidase [Amnibacterium kyonggiense]
MPDAAPIDTDHHRPRFHIRPATGFVNDPNGPVLIDGVAHLYFQFRAPMHHPGAQVLWGHATSEDLVRWTLHRPAISPHPVLGDREGAWSGNTVVREDGAVVAFYSGYRHEHPFQSVQAAVSTDGGFSFGEPRQVVADPAPEEGVRQLRDPFVWREDGTWRMVVGAGDERRVGSTRLYRSEDLETWTFEGLRASAVRGAIAEVDTGDMWECPQLVRLDGEDVLLIASWSEEVGIGQVLSVRGLERRGASDEELVVRRLDAGSNFYASSAMRESPHGALVWGWVTEGRTDAAAETAGWSGTISLPRVVRLGPDGSVLSAPVPAVDSLRQEELSGTSGTEVGAQLEVLVALPDGVASARAVLAFSADERLVIELDRDAGEVRIDRSEASVLEGSHGGVTRISAAFGDTAEVRLFLDGSVVETFTSGGRVATTRVYPAAPPPWRLEHDGTADVRLWRLGV